MTIDWQAIAVCSSVGGAVAIYYVQSTAKNTVNDAIGKHADALLGKLDGLREAVAELTTAMRIAETNHKTVVIEVSRHTDQLTEHGHKLEALRLYAHTTRHEFANELQKHTGQIEALQAGE